MAFDLGSAIDLKRFQTARKTSQDALDPYRRVRAAINRELGGSWYSTQGGNGVRDYVNKLGTTANVLAMALAYNNPEVEVASWNPQNWPFAWKWTESINRVIKNIDFRTTFYEATLDATVLWGILKVRLADSGYVKTADNQWVMPGQIWMDRVSPDDLIIDLSPKDARCVRFIGDWYRASFRRVKDRDDFDEAVVKKMAPTSKYNLDSGEEYSAQIATGARVDDDELEPMVWLYDVYFPETHQLATFSQNDDLWPLKVEDSDVGPMGPYELLSLGLVPDNLVPSSPLQQLMALHRLINRIFTKLASQATAQKNIFVSRPGDEKWGQIMKDAQNNEWVVSPTTPDQISIRGVDGPTMAFWLQNQEIYNTQSGNERALGGLGTDAPTATQEQMMLGQAGGLIGRMRSKVEQCAENCCRKIGVEMWESESLTVDGSSEIGQTKLYQPTTWRPKSYKPKPGESPTREGLRDHYDFQIRANSMGYKPPEAQLQQVVQFGQALTTMLPLAQAGKMDLAAFAEFAARSLNNPSLKKIFRPLMVDALAQSSSSGDHAATKPPMTQRTVTRNNVSPGPKGSGLQSVLGQMMQGSANGGGGTATVTKGSR
jgi:hypothetical protein